MIRYAITSHDHLPGVRLSRLGSFGNIPHADEDAAKLAALIDASGETFKIERRHYPALPDFRTGDRVAPLDGDPME